MTNPVTPPVTTDENVVIRMFQWWNGAYRDGFTPEGFARFFTEDAPFVVDGGVRGIGPNEINAHFERIRANTKAVALVVPVDATLAGPDLAFVRYRATFAAEGREGAEECMGMARLQGGRIASFEVIGRVV